MTLREPKKTETLEVRVSHETKTAFMAACAARGVSASNVLRACIARHVAAVDRAPHRWMKELAMLSKSSRRRPVLAATCGAAAIGIAAAALVAPAHAAIDPRVAAVFDWMDADNDGGIDAGEFGTTNEAAPASGPVAIEMTSRMPPRPRETRAELFRRLDGDRNGKLTADELAAGAIVTVAVSPIVAAADANGDGRIGQAELAAYLTARRAEAGVADPSAGIGLMVHGIITSSNPDESGTAALADLMRQGQR
jgi:hypothetical protein